MDKQVKSSLNFNDYVVKKINFKTNDNFKNDEESIKIDFDISHETEVKDKLMTITLNVDVFPNMEEKNYPFSIELKIVGYFSLNGDISELEKYEINGLAILYPYVRSIVSTYTANSNVPTLVLPPINIVNYLKIKKEQN